MRQPTSTMMPPCGSSSLSLWIWSWLYLQYTFIFITASQVSVAKKLLFYGFTLHFLHVVILCKYKADDDGEAGPPSTVSQPWWWCTLTVKAQNWGFFSLSVIDFREAEKSKPFVNIDSCACGKRREPPDTLDWLMSFWVFWEKTKNSHFSCSFTGSVAGCNLLLLLRYLPVQSSTANEMSHLCLGRCSVSVYVLLYDKVRLHLLCGSSTAKPEVRSCVLCRQKHWHNISWCNKDLQIVLNKQVHLWAEDKLKQNKPVTLRYVLHWSNSLASLR